MTSPRQPSLEVLLPCLDEAAGLPWVLSRVPAGIGVVLADNGSTDGSIDIAREYGARIVHVDRRGYGAACHAALETAQADLVLVMDADGSCDPGEAPRLVAPLLDGSADLVIGARRPTSRRAMSTRLRLANAVLAARLRRRTGLAITDLGPMRAAWRQRLVELAICDRRSGYPAETVVRAVDAGWRVSELDVPYHRRSGRSKVTGTWRGTIRAVRDMSAALNIQDVR